MCAVFLSRTYALCAADNPFWIDAKIAGDIATVTIGIHEVELNAFGLVLTYDRDKLKLEEAAKDGSYRYSDSFLDSYCTKGTALSNAKENRVLFSGINADMKSSRFSGGMAIISFRILEGALKPGSTKINLSVNSLNISDQLVSLKESEKKISYQLSWNGNIYTSEPEKTVAVDNTTDPNGSVKPQNSNDPRENSASVDIMGSTEPNDNLQFHSNTEDSDHTGVSDNLPTTDDTNTIYNLKDDTNTTETSKHTDEDNSDIEQKTNNARQIESIGISLETWLVIVAAILCCLGILIWRLIQRKRKK